MVATQKVVTVSQKVSVETFKDAFKNGRIIRIFPGSSIDAGSPADWTPNEIPLSEMTHFCLRDKGERWK